ncbi:YveK family protein [Geomicrobium sp. JCM 19038]|uniref:YveK family protein n=1 Tax=Geomicrobium sp. JCM 19038 TaxID=1460635 RepID=UPI0009DE6075|nr:Wzz/FepE/Etk N-terminal domain-containing protein [Geomicrobium sp. JCM 19038]
MYERKMDMKQILNALKRRWLLFVIAITVFFSSTSYVVFTVLDPVYEASESILIGQLREDRENVVIENTNMLLASTMDFLRSPMVKSQVSEDLGIPYQILDENTTVSHQERSQLIHVSVHYPNPTEAKHIVQEMTATTVNLMEQSFGVTELQVLGNASENVTVKRIDRPFVNVAIAFLVSVLFGLALVLMSVHFRDVIEEARDVELDPDLDLLGSIKPNVRRRKLRHLKESQKFDIEGEGERVRAYK